MHIGDWLGRRALITPDRVALLDECGGAPLTYGAWNHVVNRTAHLLAGRLGLRRGDRLAVLSSNRFEYLDLLFALGKVGGVLQTLSWRLPPPALAPLLGRACPAALAPEGELADRVEALRGRLPGLRCLALDAPFTTPLVDVGGSGAVCRRFQPEQVLDLVERAGVTVYFGVPTRFLLLQQHPRWAEADLSHLRLVISGGAPCPEPLFERFRVRGVALKTGYGLTEAAPNNFWLPPEDVRRKPGAVGVPLMHVDVRVCREDGAPCAPGEIGELPLRGLLTCTTASCRSTGSAPTRSTPA